MMINANKKIVKHEQENDVCTKQQQRSLIPLGEVSYMDHTEPLYSITTKSLDKLSNKRSCIRKRRVCVKKQKGK